MAPAGQTESIPALLLQQAPPRHRFRNSVAGLVGLGVLMALMLACFGTLPHTLGRASPSSPPRFRDGSLTAFLLPPAWSAHTPEERARASAAAEELAAANLPTSHHFFGTDKLGRDLLVRCLSGGAVSIGIGIAAAALSVLIGVIWGAAAGYLGGRTDAIMMRIVDVLYGLPYILLVVLLAVAGDAVIESWASNRSARDTWVLAQARAVAPPETPQGDRSLRQWLASNPEVRASLEARAVQDPTLRPRELSDTQRSALDVLLLLTAIGGVSWLTMSRVIRGQVLSLKSQPFMEAARAMGLPAWRQFVVHLLPNLIGPIIVYATLTVPQAILQESFLSFLGIGVKPPLPSWGNLASEGLSELNPVRIRWWLILFPCLLLGVSLLSLNFLGEGLREAFDPKRRKK